MLPTSAWPVIKTSGLVVMTLLCGGFVDRTGGFGFVTSIFISNISEVTINKCYKKIDNLFKHISLQESK